MTDSPRDKLNAKITEHNVARGRPLTAAEKLANLKTTLTPKDSKDE